MEYPPLDVSPPSEDGDHHHHHHHHQPQPQHNTASIEPPYHVHHLRNIRSGNNASTTTFRQPHTIPSTTERLGGGMDGAVNVSRDDSETGEEYFLPREYHHHHPQQQQHPIRMRFGLSNLSVSPEYSPPSFTSSSSTIVQPPPQLHNNNNHNHNNHNSEVLILSSSASSVFVPRIQSNNSLVELLYGEEIVASNITTTTTPMIHTTTSNEWNDITASDSHRPNNNNNSGGGTNTTLPQSYPMQYYHSNNNNNNIIHTPNMILDELGSVSTNTVSFDEDRRSGHNHLPFSDNTTTTVTTPERNDTDDLLWLLDTAATTTTTHPMLLRPTTTPTTPTTITPPSVQYPMTLSPPQLHLRMHHNDDEEENEDDEPIVDDDDFNELPPSLDLSSSSQLDVTVAATTTMGTNHHLSTRNNGTNHSSKKNRPPRVPQPPIPQPPPQQQQQYRPVSIPNTTSSSSSTLVGGGTHQNNYNTTSSSSNNSSSSAMSSIPMTPNVSSYPSSSSKIHRNPPMPQQQQQPQPRQQHYRVLSAGDASILSALTVDSGEYIERDGTLSGMTTPNSYSHINNNNNIMSSSRSYVGLPTFRDSTLRGRGGTRSLSGTCTNHRMNQRRQQRRPEQDPNSDLQYSSTSLHQEIDDTNDAPNAARMSGMDIDIPVGLQQPILGDDDNNDSNNLHKDVPMAQQPLVSVASEQLKNEIDMNSMLSPDLSPLVFHSTNPNHSTDRVFLGLSEEDEVERTKRRSFRHHKVPKLSEYETEAETAILAAIDEESKRDSIIQNMRTAIFPKLSRDEEEIILTEQEATVGKSEEANDRKSTVLSKWYALQQAEIGINDSIMRKSKPSQSYRVSAVNSLSINASTLFDKIQTNNSNRASVKATNNRDSVTDCNETTHASNLNVTNESMGQTQQIDDVALDAAENGEHRKPMLTFVDKVKQLQHKATDNVQKIIEQRKADWDAFEEFILPQKETAFGYMKNLLSFCIAPSLLLACILYYIYGNPPTGRLPPSSNTNQASISWWVIFIGVRHPLVLTVARGSEYVLSNFLGSSSPRFMKLVGPRVGLVLAHSKGWPCVLLLYGIFCLQLLYGESNFVKHWLYGQSLLTIFTKANPAGDVTSREEYLRFLVMLIFLGCSVSVKRVCLGYYFGRRICARYSNDLHELLEKLLLLSEIATLSFAPRLVSTELNVSIDVASQQSSDQASQKSQNDTNTFESSHNFQKLLEEWDEPVQSAASENHVASLRDILEFRQTVHLMQTDYPFSRLFGRADSREACVTSSAIVYDRLVDSQLGSTNLQFSTLAKITTTGGSGGAHHEKLKRLTNLFRPNKDKELTLLDFTRSVDSVYRELRTLSAGISNATAIDRVFEMILNICIYTILFFICIGILGIGVLTFAVTFSSTILALSFIVGSACSSIFEGLMMILVRRPYDIGDRIALSNVDDETDPTGSFGWIVEDIDIFYTTVRFGATREVATLSNGSLVRCRIINARRSDDAQLMIRMKFGINTSSQQINLFQSALEKFIEDRPQEYHNTLGFRLNTVVADLGYIEYMIVVQCRSSWQKIASVLDSRAKVNSFCLELQKQLDMRYVAPPMPINLNLNKPDSANETTPSNAIPRRFSKESGPSALQHRGSGRRDSDLVFSVQSNPKGSGVSEEVESMVAHLLGEGKKNL